MSEVELISRLRTRADQYRQSGPSAEHTASMLDEAAAALASAQAENERLREALSEISRATTPPEQHGHYLAHRSAVKIARAAVSNTDGGEG